MGFSDMLWREGISRPPQTKGALGCLTTMCPAITEAPGEKAIEAPRHSV
jgi:hypothetical protein